MRLSIAASSSLPPSVRCSCRSTPRRRAIDVPADKTLSPYFFVEGGDPAIDRLPLKDTRVDVAIAGVIADVTVRQVYENRGTRPIHARYVFPASTRAAVYGMTMTVGDVRTVARIRERKQAAREFEAAKREGKSASLLEQSRPNVFTMKVANVLPGDTISVELKYTELLVPTDGVYEFVYPTVVGPRYSEKRESQASPADEFVKAPYTHQGEAPRSEFHLSGVVSTGVPLQELASPSHQLDVRSSGAGRVGDRRSPTPSDSRAIATSSFATDWPARRSPRDCCCIRAGTRTSSCSWRNRRRWSQPDEMPPREYIFVLDVSGSMNGFPLDTAKKLMGDLANVLRPSDTFNIVVFADGSDTFSPVSVPATRPNLTRALQFIGQKNGGGGTRLLAALERAVARPASTGDVSRSIVLVTDGYIEAEADVFDYVRAQLDDVNFFAFGIGSSVNRFLIEGVARAGLGEPFIVTEPAEAAEAAARLRRYIDTPVLTGIDVTFNGFDAYDVEPRNSPGPVRQPPDCRLRKVARQRGWIDRDLGQDRSRRCTRRRLPSRRRAPTRVTVRFGICGHEPASRTCRISVPSAPSEERVAEITSLGLTYGLLTRYTSFVAVQEIVRRTTEGADDVDQPLPLPAGVSDLAVGVTSGPEPEHRVGVRDRSWRCSVV